MPNTKGYAIRQKVIDRCLQNEKGFSIQEIMDKCNLELEERGLHIVSSKNTIRDDITEIQNTYYVDVETICKGRSKKYRYKERGFSIYNAPLSEKDMTNLNEVLANLSMFHGRPQFEWIENTCLHIQSLLSCHPQKTNHVIEFDDNPNLKGRQHITTLFDAIRLEHSLEIEYKTFKAEKAAVFIIHPYYLKEYNNRWFLLAQIDNNQNISNFALDRIVSIKDAHIKFIRNNQYDFEEYFKDIVGVSRHNNSKMENVLIHVKKELLPYIETKPIHQSQKLLRQDNEGGIIQISVIPNFELEQVILSYGDGVKVMAPMTLVDRIKKKIMNSAKNYD